MGLKIHPIHKQEKKFDQKLYKGIDWEKAGELFKHSKIQHKSILDYPSVKDLLRVLACAGEIGLMFAFPKAASSMAPLLLGNKPYKPWATKKVLSQLERQKDVTFDHHEDGTVTVKVTRNGMVKALNYQLDTMQLRPQKWDKKWRVVIFDIPDKEKRLRDLFRMRLGQLSLYQLQKSVFVSPHPCFDEIEFLRALYGVSFNVKYLLVEKIEDDYSLKKHFNLEE